MSMLPQSYAENLKCVSNDPDAMSGWLVDGDFGR